MRPIRLNALSNVKIKWLVASILSLLTVQIALADQPGQSDRLKININDAIAETRKASPLVRAADHEVARLVGVRRERSAEKTLRLGVIAAIAERDRALDVSYLAAAGLPRTDRVQARSQQSLNLNVAQPIDISKNLRLAADRADADIAIATYSRQFGILYAAFEAKTAFYHALQAQATLKQTGVAAARAQGRYAGAKERNDHGTGPIYDVYRAQADLDDTRQKLSQAQLAFKVSLSDLLLMMGRGQEDPVELVETTETLEPPQNLDAAIREALGNRMELSDARAWTDAARIGIDMASRSSYPSMDLRYNLYTLAQSEGWPVHHNGWEVELSVTLPIFDGGAARARTAQARAVVAGGEDRERALIETVKAEVRRAYDIYEEVSGRQIAAVEAIANAEGQNRLAARRYNNGLATLLELQDSENALRRAQTNASDSLYGAQLAHVNFARALGRSIP